MRKALILPTTILATAIAAGGCAPPVSVSPDPQVGAAAAAPKRKEAPPPPPITGLPVEMTIHQRSTSPIPGSADQVRLTKTSNAPICAHAFPIASCAG